jgi:hypothetical protein
MRDEQRFPWVPPEYSRRQVFRIALGGAATAASAALLAACGRQTDLTTPEPTTSPSIASTIASTPSAVATAPAASSAALPAKGTARAAVNGKLPSPAPNVPDAYLTPPAPFKSVAAVPGRGSKISITKASQRPPTVPHDQNQCWQELDKRLGSTLDFTLVPLPQYTE